MWAADDSHQFRHAAAAIYLKDHPGEYEIVRQLLGHRNIQTTMNFYVGLNMIQASELFSEIIQKAAQTKNWSRLNEQAEEGASNALHPRMAGSGPTGVAGSLSAYSSP